MLDVKGFMEIMGIVNNAMNFGNKNNNSLPNWWQQLIKNAQDNYDGGGKKNVTYGTTSTTGENILEVPIPQGAFYALYYDIATYSAWYGGVTDRFVWTGDTLWYSNNLYDINGNLIEPGEPQKFIKEWLK